MLPSFTPGCRGPVHPGVKDDNTGVFTELCACLWQKKRGLLWNEEPYFADLIPVIFIFTFVYSIISYAFEKAYENNVLFFNNMIKCNVSEVIEE